MKNETEIVKNLIKSGYKVEIVNPDAKHFGLKYKIYTIGPLNEPIVTVVDDEGNAVGSQG
jgi:hypothetical protein